MYKSIKAIYTIVFVNLNQFFIKVFMKTGIIILCQKSIIYIDCDNYVIVIIYGRNNYGKIKITKSLLDWFFIYITNVNSITFFKD